MEKILKLIKFIGFKIVEDGIEGYETYSYNGYRFFIEKETIAASLHNKYKDEGSKLLIFDCNLDNENNINIIIDVLNKEFKYELRKLKIKNLKLNDF